MRRPSLLFFFLFYFPGAMIFQSVGKATSCLFFVIILLMSVLHVQHYCLYAMKNVILPDSDTLCFWFISFSTGSLITRQDKFCFQFYQSIAINVLLRSQNMSFITLLLRVIKWLMPLNSAQHTF